MAFDPRSVGVSLTKYLSGQLLQILYILFFLHRLRVFDVNQQAMFSFYRTVLENIIRCGMTVWYGNLSVGLVQTAMRATGRTGYPFLQAAYEQSVLGQHYQIHRTSFPLNMNFYLLRRRSRVPKCKSFFFLKTASTVMVLTGYMLCDVFVVYQCVICSLMLRWCLLKWTMCAALKPKTNFPMGRGTIKCIIS